MANISPGGFKSHFGSCPDQENSVLWGDNLLIKLEYIEFFPGRERLS